MISAFTATAASGLLALAGLTLDGGLALAAQVDAIGHAQAAARAGAQAVDLAHYRATGTIQLEPEHAVAAVHTYLAGAGLTGQVIITGTTVTVTVTTNHSTQLLGLVGIDVLTVNGTGSAQPHHGIGGVSGEFASYGATR